MRVAREKVVGRGCYYHLMNRVAGTIGTYPLTDIDREKGMKIISQLSSYYLLEFISMCWMGNHFHIVLYAPSENELPDNSEIAVRHNIFFNNHIQKIIDPADEIICSAVGRKMIDISHFMKLFQQKYTYYVNHTHNRRGRFWADRFKSTILEGREALWSAVKYVELNPVRAGLVSDPVDYRHCTWGWFSGSGKHLFAKSFETHMRKALGERGSDWTKDELFVEFREEIARTIAYEMRKSGASIGKTVKKVKRGETMSVRFLHRTRHWTDGGIIGSKLFILETASLFRDKSEIIKKQFSHGKTADGNSLYCLKRLRLALD